MSILDFGRGRLFTGKSEVVYTGDPTSLACDNMYVTEHRHGMPYHERYMCMPGRIIPQSLSISAVRRLRSAEHRQGLPVSASVIWGMCCKNVAFQDLCHCHTKRRIGRQGPNTPSFSVTPTVPCKGTDYQSIIGVIPKEDDEAPPTNPSVDKCFFWCDKFKRRIFAAHISLVWQL